MASSGIQSKFSKSHLDDFALKVKEFTLPQIQNLFLITINHRTAPIAVRERFTIPEQLLTEAIQNLKNYKSLKSFLLLSTCSRTEIYFKAANLEGALIDICEFFAKYLGVEERVAKEYNMVLESSKAVEHAFKVACGLDSLVVGENQVFSQVRFAYSQAQKEKVLDGTLELLFQSVIKSTKEIHRDTNLSKGCQSVSSAVIDLANKVAGPLKTKKIMVLGAGKMAKLALEHVLKTGGSMETAVLNRSPHRIIEFPIKYKVGNSVPFEDVYAKMNDVDIVIIATGAPHFVIFADQFEKIRKNPAKPLSVFDISMPRNVDSEFRKLPNVKLYDIDSLQLLASFSSSIVTEDNNLVQAGEIISAWTKRFYEELAKQEVNLVIKDLRTNIEKIRSTKISKLPLSKTTFTKEELDYITRNIINAVFHSPLKKVKAQALCLDQEERLQILRDLFELY